VKRLLAVLACVLALAACQPPNGDGGESTSGTDDVPEGCAAVDVASSPEKVELLTELAATFNDSDAASDGGCVVVRVQRKSSGAGATALVNGWTDEVAEGPKPVIWSPAASSWGAVVNQQLANKGDKAVAPPGAKSFMLTPLVIAMPRPMAQALGWPDTPIGYSDLLALAQNPEGWASKGHPEWGAFRLGKTNPNFSTSALSATIAQYYAATGKQRDLTLEDINRPEVTQFNQGVESAVVHYGDITLTFLNNWFRNDARGTSLTYVSAVAVEEKSVIDYNRGNPDGITDPGERPRPPKVPLVAIYPKEGTLFSDSPFYVLDAPWVSAAERSGAQRFERFVQQPANQRKILRFGFRPGNPAVAVGSPIVRANGVDPGQPQTTLGLPSPPVLVRLIERWGETRKSARVLLVIDVSGSMSEDAGNGETKLELAKRAAIDALAQFKPDDQVGVRIFSTNLRQQQPSDYIDLVPIGPVGGQRERLGVEIGRLIPREGTPLYTVARESYQDMKKAYDPARINAVLLLTDGRNDDEHNNDLNPTLSALRAGSEGLSSSPVRLFTIAYGHDADKDTLKRMADATNAAAYDASDPQTIAKVFTAVVSNF
jgi:Ca-activated chloride channel family protein